MCSKCDQITPKVVQITKSGLNSYYNGTHSTETSFLLLYSQIWVKKCPGHQLAEKQSKQPNFTNFFLQIGLYWQKNKLQKISELKNDK